MPAEGEGSSGLAGVAPLGELLCTLFDARPSPATCQKAAPSGLVQLSSLAGSEPTT